MAEATPEHLIRITRVLDAPRELVFAAWTDPDQVARWFGPQGFETARDDVEIDLRVGGRYHLRMVQPESGTEYALRYEIVELVEPELLVLRSEPMPQVGVLDPTLTRVELEEHAGGTLMTLTDGPYAQPGGAGADAGWASSFERLAAAVASPA